MAITLKTRKELHINAEEEGRRSVLMRKWVSFTQPIYRNLSRKSVSKWGLTVIQLALYPNNSLANRLGGFLSHYQFELMAQLESHDVFHVLLGYSPSVLDEARMQYCLVGSGRRSVYSLGTCLMAACIYPEYILDFKQHFKRGRTLEDFSNWDFKSLLSVDIEELQQSIKKEPFIL